MQLFRCRFQSPGGPLGTPAHETAPVEDTSRDQCRWPLHTDHSQRQPKRVPKTSDWCPQRILFIEKPCATLGSSRVLVSDRLAVGSRNDNQV